jgi:hypothetical protein
METGTAPLGSAYPSKHESFAERVKGRLDDLLRVNAEELNDSVAKAQGFEKDGRLERAALEYAKASHIARALGNRDDEKEHRKRALTALTHLMTDVAVALSNGASLRGATKIVIHLDIFDSGISLPLDVQALLQKAEDKVKDDKLLQVKEPLSVSDNADDIDQTLINARKLEDQGAMDRAAEQYITASQMLERRGHADESMTPLGKALGIVESALYDGIIEAAKNMPSNLLKEPSVNIMLFGSGITVVFDTDKLLQYAKSQLEQQPIRPLRV